MRSLNLVQGVNKTAVLYLDIYRIFDGDIKLPELNKPYIFYIADGSIRLYTPSGILDYISGQYSVSAMICRSTVKLFHCPKKMICWRYQ